MLTKIDKNNYIVLRDGERFPAKLNIKRTDAALEKLSKAFKTINEVMGELYNGKDSELYDILENMMTSGTSLSVDDGRVWQAKYLGEEIDDLLERFRTGNDEMPKVEDVTTLEDIGYKRDYTDSRFYEKPVSEDGDVEVTEEIVFDAAGAIRRERTIVWEKTGYGKSSKKITYKALPITKKLAKIIDNTRREKKHD